MAAVYVQVGCDDMKIPIDEALLQGYPGYVKTGGEPRFVTAPVPFSVLSTLRKVLVDLPVLPGVDLASHKDLYSLLAITTKLGVPAVKLYSGSFKGWTEHRKWVDLAYPEYMYLVWSLVEELVDFRKYMRLARNPFDMVARAIELPEVRANSHLLFNMILYFSEFKLELCFDMNNEKVQSQIARLRADHEKIREKLVINPHDYMDYFAFTGTSEERWECKEISNVKPPVIGECVIASKDVVAMRLREFTCGLLDAPLNPALAGTPFPWENVAFAGGGATKILSADYEKKNARQSDVDLFIMGETFDIRKKTLDLILDWFDTFNEERSRTYYAIRGSVITIYVKGVNRKIQLISSNAKTIYDVIGKFDMTHIQWAYWNGRFYGTPQAAVAARTRLSKFSNTRSIRTYRLIKAMTCGYSIEKSKQICDTIIDITTLIEDPSSEQLQSIIREFHGYYYPVDMPDYDDEEELKHILAMICKDSNASLATNNPAYVKQNVIVSGDFNGAYESISFTTFNPALIINKGQNRRIPSMVLKTKHGIMRLTSNFLTVKRVASSDDGVKITLHADTEEFIEFTKLLEGNVYRMFRQGGVTKKLFNETSDIVLEIPRYSLDAQILRGFSCARNQRGVPLNIEEDFVAGDRIQFMFVVELTMTDQLRRVTLKPVKFIKYEATSAEAIEDVDDIEAEIEAVGREENTEPTEIKYEEY